MEMKLLVLRTGPADQFVAFDCADAFAKGGDDRDFVGHRPHYEEFGMTTQPPVEIVSAGHRVMCQALFRPPFDTIG